MATETPEIEWSDVLPFEEDTTCVACRWHIHLVDDDGVDPHPMDGASSYEIAKSLGDDHYVDGYVIRPVRGRISEDEVRATLAQEGASDAQR